MGIASREEVCVVPGSIVLRSSFSRFIKFSGTYPRPRSRNRTTGLGTSLNAILQTGGRETLTGRGAGGGTQDSAKAKERVR